MVPLQQVVDLVQEAVDPARIALGRERQAAVWTGRSPDYLPLLLGHTERFFGDFKEDRTWKMAEHELRGGVVCAEMERFPHYTFKEQLDDPAKMLYEALWEILSWARSGSDAMLSVRPYYLLTIETALGMEPEVQEETHVFLRNHLSRDEISRLVAGDAQVGNIFEKGLFPRVAECIDLMKEHLPQEVHIFPNDTAGPLVLAEKLRGNEIWYDFYDVPEQMHALLELCRRLCIQTAYWYKQRLDDPIDQSYHGSLFQAHGGVRVVGDSLVNFSPQMHKEFVVDRIRSIFREFRGGWFHSCGLFSEHLDDILAMPEVTAINLGNPELWPDFENVVRRIMQAGKVYYGAWPRRAGEPLQEYLRRAVETAGSERKGMIIFLQGDGPFPEPQETMDLWHRLQDEHGR